MKKKILNTISDMCANFLYYDRKGDKELSRDQLYSAVKQGDITIEEMVAEFREQLEQNFK